MPAGKVCTGFSKPYVAYYHASGGLVTYTGARKLARGVSVNIAPNTSDDNKFYADNVEAESASGIFTGGTLTVIVDGLFADAEKMIMGLPAAGADGFMAYGDSQQAPDVGFGCIVRYMSGGVTTYTPTVLAKVKFSQPAIDAKTQEDSIDWQTQELPAAIMRGEDANRNWKYIGADYLTEAEAEAALKKKLGVNAYAITQNLSNVTSSLAETLADENTALSAVLTVADGCAMDTVTITMGGTDITATAWDSSTNTISIDAVTGAVVITAVAKVLYTITRNLTGVTCTPADSTVMQGESLILTLTANTSGMSVKHVTVTMGGTDITASAWNSSTGEITIANAAGNIAITASQGYETATLTIGSENLTDGSISVSYTDEVGDTHAVTVSSAVFTRDIEAKVGSTVVMTSSAGSSTEWNFYVTGSGPSTIGTGETCSFTVPATDSAFALGSNTGTDVRSVMNPTGGMSSYASTDFTAA